MNTLETAYKILESLESGKKNDYMGVVISPEALKVKENEWLEVIKSLLDEGYIRGVTIKDNILGEKMVDIENIAITLSGAQYLKENSTMQKFARMATNVITIGTNLIK